MLQRPASTAGNQQVDRVEQKFESVRPQIQREVASMFPADWLKASGASPIEVTLRRSTVTPVVGSSQQLSQLFEKYWPTAAALVVGLVLLSLVVGKPTLDQRPETNNAEILSLAGHRDSGSDANPAEQAKTRINRMFRDNPDKAAAALEGWIKKAS